MRIQTVILFVAASLAACSTRDQAVQRDAVPGAVHEPVVETLPDATSTARTVDGYKLDLAQRISQVNSTKVYVGRPQALLRSVVVVRYTVDAQGKLLKSEIMRSNRDRETEATALATLRGAAPFPKPATQLLRHGRLELAETWLFNNDGRFQLRSIAEPQMDR